MGLRIRHLFVRRSAFISATPERVWQEFETSDRIAAWLDQGHVLESLQAGLGGQVEMSVEIDGSRRAFGGPIVVYEPAREMSIAMRWYEPWGPAYATAVPSYWTFLLTPLYTGTLVEIFHHGFELTGDDAGDNLEGYEEGWDVKHLKALRAIVEA